MKVEIHRENYQAYVKHKVFMDSQRLILHSLSGEQGVAPITTPVTSYQKWNVDHYNWHTME
jgi:hypothetical protein